jgi:bacteriocin biosynthesis cyclodehydratase domain-containing protein
MARSLPIKPKIHAFFDVIFMEDHSCQLRAGDDRILILRGRTVAEVLPHLFPHLDGTYTLSELVRACKGLATEEELIAILERLNAEDIIEDAALSPPSTLTSQEQAYYASQLLFFSHFTGDKYAYQAKLTGSQVAVIGLGAIGTAVLIALARSGVGHIVGVDEAAESGMRAPSGVASVMDATNPNIHFTWIETRLDSAGDIAAAVAGKDVVAVALDKPRAGVHESINQVCLEKRIPWITCGSLRSMAGTVGPFFVPYETCCYACYDLRVKSNCDAYHEYMAYEKYLEEEKTRPNQYGYLPGFATVTGDLMALEIIKHLTQFIVPDTYGALFYINFLTLQTEIHEVLKLPRCPSCGAAARTPPRAAWSA